ncbi:hypothetical protein PMJ10TS2_73840 [Paenibacillus melissococcoides]
MRAIRQHFQGVTWQRCQTHFIRNVLDATPKSLKEDVHRAIRGVLDAPDLETARLLLDKTLETYSEKAERAMRILELRFRRCYGGNVDSREVPKTSAYDKQPRAFKRGSTAS